MHRLTYVPCCALFFASLAFVAPALAADAPAPAGELPPVLLNAAEQAPTLRMEYAMRAPSNGARDDHLALMASSSVYGLLYEHESYLGAGAPGALSMNRMALMLGGPSRPGASGGYIGIGETVVHGLQEVRTSTLLLQLFLSDMPGWGTEVRLAMPVSQAGTYVGSFGGGNRGDAQTPQYTTRQADAELGWRWQWPHAALRLGYRTFSVNTASHPGGWYLGFLLYD